LVNLSQNRHNEIRRNCKLNSTFPIIREGCVVTLIFILYSCAAIQGPPGGPKDETPPELIETIPADGTIHFEGGRVELIFSEYMDANTVEKAIRVLPTFENPPEIVYKGRRVFVEFPDSLNEKQTYIISIGRILKDEHKVAMSQGIQVAFATGDKIDEGKISGSITYNKAASVHLWKIQNEKDSTEFYQRIPDYVVDASDSGHFEFGFLSDGIYRCVAVDHSSAGLPISSNRMVIGLPWVSIIRLGNEKEKSHLNIRISNKMGPIKMIQAAWKMGNWATVTFSEKINDFLSDLEIKALFDDSTFHVPEQFIDPLDNKKIHITLPNLGDTQYVTFKTNGIIQGENAIIDSGMIRVKVDTTTDTTFLEIKSPPKKYVLPIQEENIVPLSIVFSNLINQEESQSPFLLNQDTLPIPFELIWKSPNNAMILPQENWRPKTSYTLSVFKDKIQPIFGQSLKDSVKIISFKTSEFQGYGRLIGSIVKGNKENVRVEVSSMEKEPSTFRSVVNSNGIFDMNLLPDGNYTLLFFQDKDETGRYSYGKIQPYEPSEWFYEYPDTVKIRTNWDLELNQINLEQIP